MTRIASLFSEASHSAVLSGENRFLIQNHVFTALRALIPAPHRDCYDSECQRVGKKRVSVAATAPVPATAASTDQPQNNDWMSRKRAKLLLELQKDTKKPTPMGNAETAARSGPETVPRAVDIMEEAAAVTLKKSGADYFALTASQANPKKLDCPICMDVAKVPCVSKSCGHICCEQCWVQWLNARKQSVCPVCRTSVSIDKIARLHVKV